MRQWNGCTPGCSKLNDIDEPELVSPNSALSQTSGWLEKLPLNVTVSPVLIVGIDGL